MQWSEHTLWCQTHLFKSCSFLSWVPLGKLRLRFLICEMKMLVPASQGWLWALDKAAVLWLVLITAIFNINIILMGRFHIFQECKSKLELTRIWTLGFSFFFVPVSRQSGAQEKNSAARASAPNVELGADPEWGLCWLMPSPPPLPHHTWVPQPLWEELLTAPSLSETGLPLLLVRQARAGKPRCQERRHRMSCC